MSIFARVTTNQPGCPVVCNLLILVMAQHTLMLAHCPGSSGHLLLCLMMILIAMIIRVCLMTILTLTDTTDLDPPPSVVLDNAPSTSNSAAEANDDILATFASLVARFYTACNVLSSVESTLTRVFLSLYTVPYRTRA